MSPRDQLIDVKRKLKLIERMLMVPWYSLSSIKTDRLVNKFIELSKIRTELKSKIMLKGPEKDF
jgi:hypothetical protein